MVKGIRDWRRGGGDRGVIARAEAARQAGFAAFEPVLAERGAPAIAADESGLRRLGEAVRGAGVDIASLYYTIPPTLPTASPNEQVRQDATGGIPAALDRAGWLGAGILTIDAGQLARLGNDPTPKITYADALNAVYENLRPLAYEAESRAVVIAVENPVEAFLLSPVEMRELLDRVGSPWVQACLNVGRVQRFGRPADWIETLGPRIVRVYATDRPGRSTKPDRFCPPGDGEVDWPAVVAALRQVNYQGPLTCVGPGEPAELSRRLDGILASA